MFSSTFSPFDLKKIGIDLGFAGCFQKTLLSAHLYAWLRGAFRCVSVLNSSVFPGIILFFRMGLSACIFFSFASLLLRDFSFDSFRRIDFFLPICTYFCLSLLEKLIFFPANEIWIKPLLAWSAIGVCPCTTRDSWMFKRQTRFFFSNCHC